MMPWRSNGFKSGTKSTILKMLAITFSFKIMSLNSSFFLLENLRPKCLFQIIWVSSYSWRYQPTLFACLLVFLFTPNIHHILSISKHALYAQFNNMHDPNDFGNIKWSMFLQMMHSILFLNVQIFKSHYKSELVNNYLEKLKPITLQSSKTLCIKDEISSSEPCLEVFMGNEQNENVWLCVLETFFANLEDEMMRVWIDPNLSSMISPYILTSYKNLGGGVYVKKESFQAMDIKEMVMVLSSILCDGNV